MNRLTKRNRERERGNLSLHLDLSPPPPSPARREKHSYDAAAGVASYLAGVDVGKRGAPSAVAEAVLHDGGAEEHEEGTASKHRPPIFFLGRPVWFSDPRRPPTDPGPLLPPLVPDGLTDQPRSIYSAPLPLSSV